MSGSAAAQQTNGADIGAGHAPDPAAVESVARRMGWRPKEEFRGPDGRWVDAETFIDLARERPGVFLNRMKVIDDRSAEMERRLASTGQELSDTRQALVELTEMQRRTAEVQYARARRELEAERDQAIQTGDVPAVRAKDQQLVELEQTKPPPRAATRPNGDAPANGTQTAAARPAAPPAEVTEFYEANPWYVTDAAMRKAADRLHIGIQATDPQLPLGENLKLVRQEMERLFPDKFRAPARTNGTAAETEETETETGGDNPRRREPGAVAAAGDPPGRAPRRGARTFDGMPKESKDQYHRYARMLDGKGKPLSKEEWAQSYWDQFEE